MNDSRLKGIAVILFGILLSASSAEMNRTVLASFNDFPFAIIGIIVGLIMVFKNNKENAYRLNAASHNILRKSDLLDR